MCKKPLKNARYLIALVLKEIYAKEGYSDILLNKYLRKKSLSDKDKALATRTVYGVLQWQGLIDFYLEKLSKKPLDKLSLNVLVLLRLGLYQILFLDRVPGRAAVYETVKAAKMMKEEKAAGLINGILRNFIRRKEEIVLPLIDDVISHISIKYSHPVWMVKRWLEEFGEEKTKDICVANNEIPYTFIRTNTLKTNKKKLMEALANTIYCESVDYPIEAIKVDSLKGIEDNAFFKEGHFYIQDINSMLVSHLASPKPGQKVVDLCSAPGGKTTHMAQLMENKGEIIAIDIHAHRLQMVRNNCKRLGIDIVKTLKGDARELLKEKCNKNESSGFDLCLVDAPCSAFGVLRKQPELKWRINKEEINSLKKLQKELLETALKVVKSEGKIVYSTCTLSSEENQVLIKELLRENSHIHVVDLKTLLPDGVLEKAYKIYDEGILFLPSIEGGDGFFMTCLTKAKQL